MLITGKTNKEHLENLDMVLQHFSLAGAHLRREKCVPSTQVNYLGYGVDKTGLHRLEDKVKEHLSWNHRDSCSRVANGEKTLHQAKFDCPKPGGGGLNGIRNDNRDNK
eukprot:g36623.t1